MKAIGRGGNARWTCMKRNDQAFEYWQNTQKVIVRLLSGRKYRSAIRVLSHGLKASPPKLILGEMLLLRSTLWEEIGDLRRAKADLFKSCRLSKPWTFSRYVRQHGLGVLCERMSKFDDAKTWYRAALRTCALGRDSSCGAALRRLLALCPQGQLSGSDKRLCERAILSSWRTLGLKGNPKLKNLGRAVQLLVTRENQPPMTRGE